MTFLAAGTGSVGWACASWMATRRSTASSAERAVRSGSGTAGRRAGRGVRRARPAGPRRWPAVNGVHRCFAALAGAADVGAGAELDVAAGEPGELGEPQAGLDGEREQGAVAPSGPGPGSGAASKASASAAVRKETGARSKRLCGMASTRGMSCGVLGVAQRGVAEQGADRGEPGVAGAGAVVAFGFEVVQERPDQRRRRGRPGPAGEGGFAGALLAAKRSSSRQVSR